MTAWQQFLHGLYKEDICVSDYISINMFVFRLYYYVIKRERRAMDKICQWP